MYIHITRFSAHAYTHTLSLPLPLPPDPHRERSNSTEVSPIIISVPHLTGRHIAAISGNQTPGYPPNGSQSQPLPPQQQQQQSSDPYRGSRVKSEYGGSGGTAMDSPSHPSSLHIAPQSVSVPSSAGGKSPHHPAPTFGQLAAPQAPLTATIISSSSSASSSPSVNSPVGPHPNSLPLSVSGSPLASVSPSRRPGIFRKRPHERCVCTHAHISHTLTEYFTCMLVRLFIGWGYMRIHIHVRLYVYIHVHVYYTSHLCTCTQINTLQTSLSLSLLSLLLSLPLSASLSNWRLDIANSPNFNKPPIGYIYQLLAHTHKHTHRGAHTP